MVSVTKVFAGVIILSVYLTLLLFEKMVKRQIVQPVGAYLRILSYLYCNR